MSDLLKEAKTKGIEVPQFVIDYSNQFETIEDLNNCQDYITEYADSNCPVYYTDIEEQYNNCGMDIDDAIEEGLVEAMKSEADINNAKLVCIFMCIERDTTNEVETFIEEMES